MGTTIEKARSAWKYAYLAWLDNDPAIAFFKRLGFANPEEHVYPSLNLTGKK